MDESGDRDMSIQTRESQRVLDNLSRVKTILAESETIEEALNIRDAAVAAHAYAKAKDSDEIAQMAMDLKLRAERKAGGFLKEMPKSQGAAQRGCDMQPRTYKELGIEKTEAHRWQRIASIPEERFESYLFNARQRTQSALLIEAARQIRPEHEKVIIEYPTDVYACIVIDPPWPIKKIERHVRQDQGLYLDYPTMSLEEIAKIPIPKLAFEDGCHIYLWVTQKYLPHGLDLFEKWGVKYQCIMTWVKPVGITPYTWMYNTEHVLFGRIGSLSLLRNGIKLSFNEPTREHSRKPDTFYDIVRMASPEPRLELFARQPREGFIAWGNETEKFSGE